MSTLYYAKRRGAIECEKFSPDGSNTLELRFEDGLNGSVRLGAVQKNIIEKRCIFDTGALEDGIYHPFIYLGTSIIEAEGFEISKSEVRLIPKDDGYVRELSREAEALRREIGRIKDTLAEFDKKINGNPIF